MSPWSISGWTGGKEKRAAVHRVRGAPWSHPQKALLEVSTRWQLPGPSGAQRAGAAATQCPKAQQLERNIAIFPLHFIFFNFLKIYLF